MRLDDKQIAECVDTVWDRFLKETKLPLSDTDLEVIEAGRKLLVNLLINIADIASNANDQQARRP